MFFLVVQVRSCEVLGWRNVLKMASNTGSGIRFCGFKSWLWLLVQFSSVTQSCLTLCDPMSRSTPGLPVHHKLPVYSNSCPSSQWCHPAISSSVIPFSSCPQSLPASGSFPLSQLFTWGGQSIGVSASASVLPMNIQDLTSFRMDWLDLLAVQGTLKRSSPTPQFKSINFSALSFLHSPTLTSIHDHWKNLGWWSKPLSLNFLICETGIISAPTL